jgi:hypothetical protein
MKRCKGSVGLQLIDKAASHSGCGAVCRGGVSSKAGSSVEVPVAAQRAEGYCTVGTTSELVQDLDRAGWGNTEGCARRARQVVVLGDA